MKTITGIHGVPRSGTSWLAQMFNASPEVNLKFQPLFSYEFKGVLNKKSSQEEISSFFEDISVSDDDFVNMRDTKLLKNYPNFLKSKNLPHLVFKHVRYHYILPNLIENNKKVKLVLLLRNPLSVLSSWKNAPREFNKDWNFMEEWKYANKKNINRADYFGYIKWKEASNLFIELERKYPDRVKTIAYKPLLNNTFDEMKNLFQFADINFHQKCIDFINESKSIHIDDPNSVFKIKESDNLYLNDFPKQIIDEIRNDLKGTKLENLLS